MEKKIVKALLLLTLVILGAPTVLAKPEYLPVLNNVYGNGSCDTCHVDGPRDGPRTPYGMLFENQSDHVNNTRATLMAIGAPTAETPGSTLTPVITTTPIPTESPVETPAAKASSGFGITLFIAGLLTCALLTGRHK